MAAFTTLLSSFDSDAGKRGKQFEHFVKWFLKNDPEWSTQVDQVWLWEEYPDRWGIDCGIDLVFRHKNGEAWAVQAKCYSQQHDITKHDIDKFLSESNRKGIEKRLLIATTDRIGANAKQVCEAQEKSVFRYLLSNFESANIEYPATLANLHTAKRKPKPAPRKHQLDAIDGVVSSFKGADRGQLIMACGTGKTFTTLWIKEKLEATSTLILLPSLGLLSQTLHEWTLAANLPFEVLCVCSDETVGKKGSDEAIHSITDVAFPVTSNVEDIRKFLYRSGAKVVFSTYQSSPLVAEAQGVTTVPDFDLVIADEAHRCAGKVGNDFTTILDAKLIRARKRLFATATPRTYSTNVKKAAGERGIDVVGMDDETVFGNVSYSLPFGEAIKRGLLTDYQVVIIGVDNPTIASWIANRELLKTDTGIENDAESLAAQIGLLKAYKDYNLKRVISFHSRVSRAEAFTKEIQMVSSWIGKRHRPSGTMNADYVSGAMTTYKRRKKLARLKALGPTERGLLTNARCLSEGVDVPSLDGIAFIDPRSSQIDIVQAVGRAIRLSTNKTTGTIVLPIFIHDGKNAQASIEGSNFKPIWDVLNALKAHDDVLSAELDKIRTEMGREAVPSVDLNAFSKIHIDLPASVDQSFGESLRTCLVEHLTNSWEYGYGLLESYSIEHGDCMVPQTLTMLDGFRLGTWVATQRSKKATLTVEKIERLESLQGWSWILRDVLWETGYKHLSEYCARHGDAMVSARLTLPCGFELGYWVSNQRLRQILISAERKARLESLPGWSWNPFTDAWEIGFQHLTMYSAKNGQCLVPASLKLSDGYPLGQWTSIQRLRRSTISPEKIARLESLMGWSWDPHDDAWEKGFTYLVNYCEVEGHCRVPLSYSLMEGYRLGAWVSQQRAHQKKLSPERRMRLEALTGWIWEPRNEAWETGFRHLSVYRKENGDCLVPVSFCSSDGFRLGSWVIVQRSKKATLTVEKIERLESLQGWSWDPIKDVWESAFFHLTEYCSENGNCLVPVAFITSSGYPLGRWINHQRAHRAKISQDRRDRLESLKGWSWDPINDAWEDGFRHLSKYSAVNNTCSVPALLITKSGFKLGQWVARQRRNRKSLSFYRVGRLEALTGWRWYIRK